ncbi:ABC transporter permease [Sphingobacterium hungaricum]|uniref:ABC transporter permease n=1 Tax=Sphingobacterium hungaricum TaxID=2082723 RepID=A0A928YTX5_9SPHI|nr:ABC transporter permease [Sphingobacterium hungaricum]MBE8715558.1 ABC transporter permease [Sphingobacterium hungaricum]
MIKNYFKTAWRNLLKNKAFSIINIIGLAIGMTGALLIALWLQNMLTMDRYHEKGDRLYIISNRDTDQGKLWAWVSTPKILGPSISTDFPEIENYSRYDDYNFFLTTFKEQKIISRTAFVDSGFFQLFTMPVLKGDINQVFDDPYSIVLTESYAKSLFGDEDPIGKIIRIDSVDQVAVKAVLKDLPANTQFKFQSLLPWSYARKIGYVDDNWSNNSIFTFILLKKDAMLEAFNQKIKKYISDHVNTGDNYIKNTGEIFAFPFRDMYLYNKGEGGNYTSGRIDLVRLFSYIGFFILAVACINFMNLSTAKSEKRAKEVGVRKVVGANKKSLIFQFLTESILISLVSVIIALFIVQLSLSSFNELVEKNLSLSVFEPQTWAFVLLFALLIGILSGIYPAFFLSSFNPIKTLKGKINATRKGFSVRSILVVIQFSIAIILIISTLIVYQQIQHTKNRSRGYDDNGLVYTQMKGSIEKNYNLIRSELLASNAITSISKNMSPITDLYSSGWGFTSAYSSEEDKKTQYNRFSTDADGIKNLGLILVEGRDIDVYTYPTDSLAVLLTESAVKKLHLENPIGETIDGDGEKRKVVGVVKDFIINSPYSNIDPMVIMGPKSWATTIHYRLNPDRPIDQNLKTIENVFKKFNPDYPFEYEFIDKTYQSKFSETQAIGTLSMLFAGLTIFISCLGLLALIAYIAETRTKEIAVRKVLGASMQQITSLLSTDFIKLVILSILIASPIAWWAMDNWLKDFSYRIDIKWYYFVIAGVMAILISLATISFQSIKAALANPVKSLRNE